MAFNPLGLCINKQATHVPQINKSNIAYNYSTTSNHLFLPTNPRLKWSPRNHIISPHILRSFPFSATRERWGKRKRSHLGSLVMSLGWNSMAEFRMYNCFSYLICPIYLPALWMEFTHRGSCLFYFVGWDIDALLIRWICIFELSKQQKWKVNHLLLSDFNIV